jgi:hypothetical protein
MRFETFGKGGPLQPQIGRVAHVVIAHMGKGFDGRFRPHYAGPKMHAVGFGGGERGTEILVANRERIGRGRV